MATKIVTKNSSTASAVPTASDLVQGELAVNVADKRLFTEDNGGSIIELGTNPSTIDINAGSIDGTAIGASSASTGAFTTLTATGLTVDTDTLYVDSTNNRVGIGTTSPSANLDIESTTGNQLRIAYNSSFYWDVEREAATGDLTFTDASNGETVRFTDDGNVGIGTTSPSEKLEIQEGNVAIRSSTISQETPFYFMRDDSGQTADYVASIGMQAASSSDWRGVITFNAKSGSAYNNTTIAERMRIDSSGNVGIGATSVDTKLHLEESGATSLFLKTQNSAGALLVGNNSAGNSFVSAQTSGKPLILETENTERMRIDSSGRLLVGKTSATATGLGTELRGSQVIIGKTSSGTVNGIYFNHNSSYVGGLNYTNTATSVATSSDQRLKENIADADDAGSKIDSIQVRKFDWKEDNSHQEYGFIAQELEQVFAYAVHTAQNEMQTKSVDYASLVPMMLKEIQSLRNRVAQLEE